MDFLGTEWEEACRDGGRTGIKLGELGVGPGRGRVPTLTSEGGLHTKSESQKRGRGSPQKRGKKGGDTRRAYQ